MWEMWLRYPVTAYQSGELVWVSGWPVWGLVIAIGAVVAALLWLHLGPPRRFGRGHAVAIAGLEIAGLATLAVMLWRPALAVDRLESRRNVVAVVLDASRSMAFEEGGSSRIERAVRALSPELRAELEDRFDVRLYQLGDGLSPLAALEPAPVAVDEHTRISAGLRELLGSVQSVPLSAVVLMSDGGGRPANELGELFADVERAGVPIHAVGVGRERLEGDVELADVSLPASALPGSRIDARVQIRNGGADSVRLRVQEGERLLAARTLELDPEREEQSAWISFEAGEAGVRDLRFSIEAPAEEPTLGNNAQARVLDVPVRVPRVLYLEGEPRWEYAFVRRALDRDPAIQLVGLLRTTDRKRYRQGVRDGDELRDGFPAERAELFAYDALILGSVEAASLEPEQHELIRDFVAERGGGLLMLGGRNGLADGGWGATVVEEVLPVRLAAQSSGSFVRSPAPVHLSSHGQRSQVVRLDVDPERNRALWSEVPPVADFQRVGALRAGALPLLEIAAPGAPTRQPLLAIQRYGRGRSAVLASGGTWRWKMGLDREDVRYATFWRQLLRFLAASSPAPVSLTAFPLPGAEEGELGVRFEVRGDDQAPLDDGVAVRAEVSPETGDPQVLELVRSMEPGVYEGRFPARPGAMYRVTASATADEQELGRAAVHVRYAPDRGEDFRPQLNRELLERLAAVSGGAYWSESDLAALPAAIQGSGLGVRQREILELSFVPAAFAWLLLLKLAAWALRRRAGGV